MKKIILILLMFWSLACEGQAHKTPLVATETLRGLNSGELGGSGVLFLPYNWASSGNNRIKISSTDTTLHLWVETIAGRVSKVNAVYDSLQDHWTAIQTNIDSIAVHTDSISDISNYLHGLSLTGDYVGLPSATYNITGTSDWILEKAGNGNFRIDKSGGTGSLQLQSSNGNHLYLRKTAGSGDLFISHQVSGGNIYVQKTGNGDLSLLKSTGTGNLIIGNSVSTGSVLINDSGNPYQDSSAVNYGRMNAFVSQAINDSLSGSGITGDYWPIGEDVILEEGSQIVSIPVPSSPGNNGLTFRIDPPGYVGMSAFVRTDTTYRWQFSSVYERTDGNTSNSSTIILDSGKLVYRSPFEFTPMQYEEEDVSAFQTNMTEDYQIPHIGKVASMISDSIADLSPGGGDVTSVFGRTGDVVAVSGDYEASEVTWAMSYEAGITNLQSGGDWTLRKNGSTGEDLNIETIGGGTGDLNLTSTDNLNLTSTDVMNITTTGGSSSDINISVPTGAEVVIDYTPTETNDYPGTDPDDVNEALDSLASRATYLESEINGGLGLAVRIDTIHIGIWDMKNTRSKDVNTGITDMAFPLLTQVWIENDLGFCCKLLDGGNSTVDSIRAGAVGSLNFEGVGQATLRLYSFEGGFFEELEYFDDNTINRGIIVIYYIKED